MYVLDAPAEWQVIEAIEGHVPSDAEVAEVDVGGAVLYIETGLTG